MVFSSPLFLFGFLPLALLAYFATGRRNAVLFGLSVFFYAWGEPQLVVLLLLSIGLNYGFALAVERARARAFAGSLLAVAVGVNIGLLAVYKYGAFIVENVNRLLVAAAAEPFEVPTMTLPLGISFFTFQALSYVVDVHRGEVAAARNPLSVGLYIALFPQLVAGPIVRYVDVAARIASRVVTRERFAQGIRRFTVGLGKKVLVANTVAVPADAIFRLAADDLTAGLAWLGVACYTLQIYFDFSGYSDMAIGLGRMFGFEFRENFAHPYAARSMTEFWRRWHISLSTWFRDYLYIPLGGSRDGAARTYLNLLVVFVLCGLWHGASWTFVVWGLYHGAFLVWERLRRADAAGPGSLLGWAGTLVAVMVGWVLFRANDLAHATAMLAAMLGFGEGAGLAHHVGIYLRPDVAVAMVVGAVAAMPLGPAIARRVEALSGRGLSVRVVVACADGATMAALFLGSAATLAAGTYNPFIYFRF